MNFIKLFRWMTIFLMLIPAANAALNDAITYYSFDSDDTSGTTMFDLSGNQNGTCYDMGGNCNTTTGILENSSYFDGNLGQIDTNDNVLGGLTQTTYSLWYKADGLPVQEILFGGWGASTTQRTGYILVGSTNDVTVYFFDGSTAQGTTFTGAVSSPLDWNHYVVRYNSSFIGFFLNGAEVGRVAWSSGTIQSGSSTLRVGEDGRGFNTQGWIDELGIWGRSLSDSEILTLYNGGSAYNPYNVGATPVIDTNLSSYYNVNNITVSLNTSTNVNMSYILGSGPKTAICTYCNLTTLNLPLLNETAYNISWISEDANGLSYNNETFTIDLTNPSLTVPSFTKVNSYNVNFSSIVSCSDTNLAYCNITTDEGKSFSYTNYSYYFGTNWNHTFNVTAVDLAGNINTSTNNIIQIDPTQYLYFEDSVGNPITNFSIDGNTYDNFFNFSLLYYGYGDQTFEFSKIGYITQSITVNLNSTSDINNTYSIAIPRILLYIRDKNTGSLLTGINFTAEFIATVGATTWTTDGLVNISNTLFQDEEYMVVISNEDYQTESVFFDFNNRELLTLNVYMLEANNTQLGTVFIKVVDRFSQPINAATVAALQWNSGTSSFVQVSQAKTGSDGQAPLNVILDDKVYIFTAEFQGRSSNSTQEIIESTENGKTITISIVGTSSEYNYILENLIYNVTENYNNVTNISTISVFWNDLQGMSQTVCINSYRLIATSETQLTENCTTGSSGIYILSFDINSSYTTLLKAEIDYYGSYIVLDKFTYLPDDHPSDILAGLGLNFFVVPFLFIAAIALGLMVQNVYVGTMLLALFSGLSLTIAPDVLSKSIVAFLFFVGWLTIVYGGKQR